MQFIPQPQALHVVGIALRTHNGGAVRTIPPLWTRFARSGLAGRLPHRLCSTKTSTTHATRRRPIC